MAAVETTHSARPRMVWEPPALAGVLGLATFLYVFNLTVSGFANTYYAMAAQAAGQDWSAWFWGSLDPSNFITVDKPPLATMLMGLSVRLFGLSSWSLLLPEALFGVATIAVLFVVVRRYAGPVAATIAALVATLTPAAVLIFRYNNPDALLTLLLVLAAWAFTRALEGGRLRWVVLSALFVGLAFNTKFLQAYLVLPAFAIVYVLCAPGSVRKRLVGLLVAAISVLVFSSWWIVAVQLTPAEARPFIGGSTDGTALQLLFGYDGLGRIFGFDFGRLFGIGGGPGGSPGGAFAGEPGLLRLLNPQFGGQIAWLLPFAAIGSIASLVLRRDRPRTDVHRAAVVMWTLWLLVHALVFSFMNGIIHSYYTVAMAPAIGALVGTGVVDVWRARETHPKFAGLALAAAIATSTAIAVLLLGRTSGFAPGLAALVVVIGCSAALVVALLAVSPDALSPIRSRQVALVATCLGVAALLIAPAAYATQTITTSYSGGDPQAGPPVDRAFRNGFPGFPGGPGPFGPGTDGDGGRRAQPGQGNSLIERNPGSMSAAELAYLIANRGTARWIVAAESSDEAAPIQLESGQPVMAMGGFNGADPAPTLDQLKAYVASGELRFVLAGAEDFGGFGPALGYGADLGVGRWVRETCAPVKLPTGSSNGLYDCAGAT